jgi:hypothetical protein
VSSGKGHKNSENLQKVSTKCGVFLSSGDFPSLMEIPNFSGMNQQKHVRNRQNNGEFLVSTYMYFRIRGDVLM